MTDAILVTDRKNTNERMMDNFFSVIHQSLSQFFYSALFTRVRDEQNKQKHGEHIFSMVTLLI